MGRHARPRGVAQIWGSRHWPMAAVCVRPRTESCGPPWAASASCDIGLHRAHAQAEGRALQDSGVHTREAAQRGGAEPAQPVSTLIRGLPHGCGRYGHCVPGLCATTRVGATRRPRAGKAARTCKRRHSSRPSSRCSRRSTWLSTRVEAQAAICERCATQLGRLPTCSQCLEIAKHGPWCSSCP